MTRPHLIMPTMLLILHGGFIAAQERFELSVPRTTTTSTAELTASSLTINNRGNVSVYSRDPRYDVPGFQGFTSKTQRQIIRWPSTGSGSMQIASIPLVGAPQFRASQMQITRVGTKIGTASAPPRRGPVDTTLSYRLTNDFLGKGNSLAADPRGDTSMEPSDEYIEQAWKFVPVGRETYRLTNAMFGDGHSLTAHGKRSRLTMNPTVATSKDQLWKLTKVGTLYRLTNEGGAGWSLDTGTREAIVDDTANVSGQFWSFTELPTVIGSWEEVEVRGNRPKGITVDIWGDLKAKVVKFHQRETGQPDTVGEVDWARDRLTLNHYRGSRREEFLVSVKSDRIDFLDLSRTPTGFFWRRVRSTPAGTMKLTSPAFARGAAIPAKYTGVGADVSPPLSWANAPVGTKSFALICDDPDAPSRAAPRPEGPWVHWVVYNIPANTRELPAAVTRRAELALPVGARQGINDFGSDNVGYRGPMPPKGTGPHRYFFKIYALDRHLDLPARIATKKSLLAAMKGHILAEGELMGTFDPLTARPRARLISKEVIPNPPLEPVTLEMSNSHTEEIWVLVADLRTPAQGRKFKIPAGKSASVKLDRDSGSTIVEQWEIMTPRGATIEERVAEVPPQQLYDISVYELFVQSVSIDRTQAGRGRVDNVNRVPKSVGLINVPGGAEFKGGKTQIYKHAKGRNPGAVRKIDPANWRDSVPQDDALRGLLPPRR